MEFLTPLGLILSALALPIIALYLLKRRRDEVPVSSTLLWERTLRDLEANAPWQRLRQNLLLLLQLLVLALLVLGAARPFLPTADAGGQNLVVIVDTSMSMATMDTDAGSRLQQAREQALVLFDGLPAGGRMTILRAGGGAEVLASNTGDRRAVEQALVQLAPTAADSDLSAAFTVAATSVARTPDSRIVLLSDGNVALPPALSIDAPVRFVSIGSSDDNQAVSALTLRREGQGYELFTQVANYGTQTVERRLVVDVDGAPFTAVDLLLPAGERTERIFELPAETQQVHARLGGDDVLPTDDEAWAVPARTETRHVRLVTPGNRFLHAGLSLLSNVELTVSEELLTTIAPESTPDLTIIDAGVDLSDDELPTGNLLLVAPERSIGEISVTGVISRPMPLPVAGDDPLLRFVDLSDVAVLEAVQTELPSWARPVIRDGAGGAPLLWIGESDGRRIALLAFDLHESDLALRVSFPILLANLVDALTPGSGTGVPASITVGRPVEVPIPPTGEAVTLTHPDGTQQIFTTEAGSVAFAPEQAGIYRLANGDTFDVQFAANRFDSYESDVAPARSLELPGRSDPIAGETEVQRREFWPWLVAAGLLVLVVEWLVSQQDGLVRVRRWIGRYGVRGA